MRNEINIKIEKEDCFFIIGFLRDSTEIMRENQEDNSIADDIKISKIERFYRQLLEDFIRQTPEDEIVNIVEEFGEKH